MAFKILSQYETDLLSHEDRIAYEKEYAVYMERKNFVRRLEELEKVKMPSVSIKKKGIRKIKMPELSGIRMKRFTVDNGAGVNILNTTKKIKGIIDSNHKNISFSKVTAELPAVKTEVPDPVDRVCDENYKIGEMPRVNIARPEYAGYNRSELEITPLHRVNVSEPENVTAEIEPFGITELPVVNTAAPDVVNGKIAEYITELPVVNTAVPDVVNGKVEGYVPKLPEGKTVEPAVVKANIPEFTVNEIKKRVVSAPVVEYVASAPEITPHAPVKTAKAGRIVSEIPEAKVYKTACAAVSAPEVGISIREADITPSQPVTIPEFAPQIKVDAAGVEITAAPEICVPDEVGFAEPDFSVEQVQIAPASFPEIDKEKELDKILATLR